jgi:hypothetical protein
MRNAMSDNQIRAAACIRASDRPERLPDALVSHAEPLTHVHHLRTDSVTSFYIARGSDLYRKWFESSTEVEPYLRGVLNLSSFYPRIVERPKIRVALLRQLWAIQSCW